MIASWWMACRASPDPPVPETEPPRTLITRYAAFRYPASWSAEVDVEGRAALGAGRCAVEVLRVDEPPLAAATGLVHARLPDHDFDRDVATEPATWAGEPAVRAWADVRTEAWPAGEPMHLEAIATAAIAVATTCPSDASAAVRPGLALLEQSFSVRDGPVPPATTRHLRMPVIDGWTVNVAGSGREELFAYAPICSVVLTWTALPADEALAAQIAREPPAGPGTAGDAVLFGLPARRWRATAGDGQVTYRAEVTTAPLDGGTVVLSTSATEYEPCGPRIDALVPLVGLADPP